MDKHEDSFDERLNRETRPPDGQRLVLHSLRFAEVIELEDYDRLEEGLNRLYDETLNYNNVLASPSEQEGYREFIANSKRAFLSRRWANLQGFVSKSFADVHRDGIILKPVRDLPSVITHLLQPEDLDNDGVREIVVATTPSGTKSSRLLILDEDGRIIFDSDYVVHVWEDFVRRVRIPYKDIVLDRLGKVVAVYRANGELAEQYTWKDAWESIRPDRYGLPGGKYEVRALLTGNVDDSLEKEIIVVAGEPYERGLSFVAKLAPNGELLGSYWHPGPIYQVVILENVDNDAANIIGVGENSFLYSGQIFDYVFGLSGHLLTELSGWNLMKPEDLSMPKNELWQKVPGTTLWDRYEEVLRWYRWISPPKRMIMEVDVSYRPTWMGKRRLGPRQAMIDIKLKDGSYFSLNAKGDVVAQWVPAGSSTRLNERQ